VSWAAVRVANDHPDLNVFHGYSMNHNTLSWRIEHACFRAWPALRNEQISGWLLRFSEGLTRRANSANPLQAKIADPDRLIVACEARYRAQGLPTFFRITSLIDPAMQACLERRGYKAEGDSLVMYGPMEQAVSQPDDRTELLFKPNEEWLRAMYALQNYTRDRSATYAKIVTSVAAPVAYISLRDKKRIIAVAYGAIYDGLLCFESVITDAAFRGCGNARRMLASLIDWGKAAGAEGFCLQVEASNQPARRLYSGLGSKELYQYHYRREPVSS
jgi:GNAT superfamily N-acetyltransferase